MFILQNVSHVTCHMSCVVCHVSHITCHMSCVTYHKFFSRESGEAYRWRVCYQPGQTRLVYEILNLKGHQNNITDLRVTAILLNEGILSMEQSGEASPWRHTMSSLY